MPLVSMRQLLDHAAENGYGLPAFNVNNLEQVQAPIEYDDLFLDLMEHPKVFPIVREILGSDISGVVELSRSDAFSEGEEVFGFAASGAYAELAVTPAQALAAKPAGVTHEQAAALPVVGEAEKEEIRARMLERMREQTSDEWMAEFVADGNIASEPIVSAQEALRHPQALHNGHVRELEHPRLGRMRQIGPIAKLPKTPAEPSPASPRSSLRRARTPATTTSASTR